MVDRRSLAIGVFAVVVATSGLVSRAQAPAAPTAGAQGRGGPGGPGGRGAGRGGAGFGRAAFTPEPGAKDLKTILYNWTWHMGMLRSDAESELNKTLDYHAESGT